MELLPSNVLSKNVIEYSANSKGKKCASPNDSYDGPTPKWVHHDLVQVYDDVNMAEVVGEADEGSA